MGGFAVVTLLIGLLPGYESWGIASIVVLTLLRFVDGVFLGGEYTGANPLAMEYAPKEKRGEWAAFIHTGFPLSVATMSLITAGLLRMLPQGSPNSPYVQWGWRIPFFLGVVFASGVFLYYVKKVPESSIWAKAEKAKSPLKELFCGDNFRCLSQVFLVMSGVWFTLNAVTSILPGVLLTVRHVNSMVVTNAILVAHLLLAVLFVPFGMLGQRFGRRTMLVVMGVAGITAGPILYYVLVWSGYRSAVASRPAGDADQPVRHARMGDRHLVCERALSHHSQGIRLWHWLQRGRDPSCIFLLLHVGSEEIGNALRVHPDRHLRGGRSAFVAGCAVRA